MTRKDTIGDSLRENLSGLVMPRWKQIEMLESITGGIKVKKKWTVGVVFALCLMLAVAGAVAAALLWRDTAEKVAPMESAYGYYEAWNAKSKTELIRVLAEVGELENAGDVADALSAALPEEEQSALCDRIMTQYVQGAADIVTLDSIMRQMHGDKAEWSQEDLVWYEDMLKRNQLLTPGNDAGYAIPENQEINQQQAFDIGRRFYADAGITLDETNAEATFLMDDQDYWLGETQVSRKGNRYWSVVYPKSYMGIVISASGQVMNYDLPVQWQKRRDNAPALSLYGIMPGEWDRTADWAADAARHAIAAAFGISGAELAAMECKAYLGCWTREEAADAPIRLGEHLWYVTIGEKYEALVNLKGEAVRCTQTAE